MSTNALARPYATRLSRQRPPSISKPALRPGVPFLNATDIPDLFAMRISGDCLAPDLMEGDEVIFTGAEQAKAGDLAIFILRPEEVPDGQLQCAIKRLVFNVPPYVTFPWKEHPDSEVLAIVIAEQTNPRAQYQIKCDRLLAVRKFSHVQRRAAS